MIISKLKSEILVFLNSDLSAEKKLQDICDILRKEMKEYHWVGFYLVDNSSHEELVLGPYSGAATDHTRIGFGDGICGQAADTLSVFVVDDVNAESNYLACSPDVKSEYVSPVIWQGELVGELDLDSRTIAAFQCIDVEFLSWVAEVSAETVAKVSGDLLG